MSKQVSLFLPILLYPCGRGRNENHTVFVIGGKEIYELLIDRVTEVYLTTVYWDPSDVSKNPGLVSLSPEFMDKISKEFGRETIIQPRTASKRSGIEYGIVLLSKI